MREFGYSRRRSPASSGRSVLNAQNCGSITSRPARRTTMWRGLFLTHICESPNGWADGWFDDLGKSISTRMSSARRLGKKCVAL